jgi:pyrimidine-specific ribonucleoside hydrolase
MKNICLLICIALILQVRLFAHSGKPKYHVIIDTDGAIDDMRAISMLLAGNDIRVLAITCSQGTLEPNSCFNKVNSLVATHYHNGIPVGISNKITMPLPVWNGFAEQINWGSTVNPTQGVNSLDLLNRTAKEYPYKITLLALGSMKTYADWIKTNPRIANKIEQIVWYNDSQLEKGFNYLLDTASYNYIVKSAIPLKIVSNNRNDLICNLEYTATLKSSGSIYEKQILNVLQQPPVWEKVKQNHLQLWDDLVPLYLTAPILFKTEKKENISSITVDKSIPNTFVYQIISMLLNSGTSANNRVFVAFPLDTALYKKEYAGMLKNTVEKYGEIEWKAITMTNEIHGHTGIYSIIGAKMGIRAMEYFNVGVNNIRVTSFAGSTPPLSCLNDGIQISTGATIGQGLIAVSDSVIPIPTVHFECNGHKIKISLKPEMAKQMHSDIQKGVKSFGMSDEYWIYIENLAIGYWAGFNRHEIFDIETI